MRALPRSVPRIPLTPCEARRRVSASIASTVAEAPASHAACRVPSPVTEATGSPEASLRPCLRTGRFLAGLSSGFWSRRPEPPSAPGWPDFPPRCSRFSGSSGLASPLPGRSQARGGRRRTRPMSAAHLFDFQRRAHDAHPRLSRAIAHPLAVETTRFTPRRMLPDPLRAGRAPEGASPAACAPKDADLWFSSGFRIRRSSSLLSADMSGATILRTSELPASDNPSTGQALPELPASGVPEGAPPAGLA